MILILTTEFAYSQINEPEINDSTGQHKNEIGFGLENYSKTVDINSRKNS